MKRVFSALFLLTSVASVLAIVSANAQPVADEASNAPVRNYVRDFHAAVKPKLSTAKILEHLAHESGNRGAAMNFAGVGPSMPEDIGNWPWIGGLCYSHNMVRCCYSPYSGYFLSCRCKCGVSGDGNCYWYYA